MKLLSCAFNMDTACVELKFDDGITSKSRNHLEKGFELCYNTIKPTRAITIYPKRDLSPLIRF